MALGPADPTSFATIGLASSVCCSFCAAAAALIGVDTAEGVPGLGVKLGVTFEPPGVPGRDPGLNRPMGRALPGLEGVWGRALPGREGDCGRALDGREKAGVTPLLLMPALASASDCSCSRCLSWAA